MRDQKIVKQARIRDRDICQKCGSDISIEVAHKIGLWAGGTDTLENVICLCRMCHRVQPDDNIEAFETWFATGDSGINNLFKLAIKVMDTAPANYPGGREAALKEGEEWWLREGRERYK